MNKNDYEHSRPLDVHRCSEHPEVNTFIDAPKDFVKIDGWHSGLLYPGSERFYKVLEENIDFLKKYN